MSQKTFKPIRDQMTNMLFHIEKFVFGCLGVFSPYLIFYFPNPTSPIALASAATLLLIFLMIVSVDGSLVEGNLVSSCVNMVQNFFHTIALIGASCGSKNENNGRLDGPTKQYSAAPPHQLAPPPEAEASQANAEAASATMKAKVAKEAAEAKVTEARERAEAALEKAKASAREAAKAIAEAKVQQPESKTLAEAAEAQFKLAVEAFQQADAIYKGEIAKLAKANGSYALAVAAFQRAHTSPIVPDPANIPRAGAAWVKVSAEASSGDGAGVTPLRSATFVPFAEPVTSRQDPKLLDKSATPSNQ